MRAAPAFALLLLAGCGEGSAVNNGEGPSEDEIRRLSTPEVEVIDPQRPVRPQPLKIADLAPMPAPVCAFGRGGKMLLAANAGEAIARIRGRLRHLAQRAPLGPSGGFFADGRISISVGRVGGASGDIGAWPARITITNRRAGAQMEIEGVWRCDGHAENTG